MGLENRPVMLRMMEKVQADAAASGSARVQIDALLNLGIAYNRNARRPEALAKYREAEAVYRDSGLVDPRMLARIDRLIAVDLTNLDRPTEAIIHIERAHAVHLRESGPIAQDTVDCLDVYLVLLNTLERGAEGVRVTQPSFDALSREFSVPTQRRTQIMASHAFALKLGGKLDQAEAVVRESLRLEEALYGPKHKSLTPTLSKLMSILRDQGRYAEAAVTAERALAIGRASLPANHPALLFAMQNAARVALQAAKLARARSLIDEALDSQRAIGRFDTGTALWGRAVRVEVLVAQGEIAAARSELATLEPLSGTLSARERANLQDIRKRLDAAP